MWPYDNEGGVCWQAQHPSKTLLNYNGDLHTPRATLFLLSFLPMKIPCPRTWVLNDARSSGIQPRIKCECPVNLNFKVFSQATPKLSCLAPPTLLLPSYEHSISNFKLFGDIFYVWNILTYKTQITGSLIQHEHGSVETIILWVRIPSEF